jgi:cysteinyl-tRNA synthetase
LGISEVSVSSYDKRDLLLDFDRVLGLGLDEIEPVERIRKVDKEVEGLVQRREELRKQKKWEEADKMRQKIEKLGWQVEDKPEGPNLKKIKPISLNELPVQ